MYNVTTRKWMLIILCLVLLLVTMPLVAACDDDDDETTITTAVTTTTEPPTTTAVAVEPTTIQPAGELLTIDSKLGDLLANPDAKAILEEYLAPDIMANAPLVSSFSLPELAPRSGGRVTDEMLAAMAADLEALGAYSTTAAPTTTPAKTTSKLTGDSVKVAVQLAWTGPMGMGGILADQCMEVCDYLIEERGGVWGGRPIKWEKYDTEGDIARAQAGTQKFASDEGVLAIAIGGCTTGEMAAVMELSSELRIPYFTQATEEVSDYPYTVRAGTANNVVLVDLCAGYALENFDPDTVAFLAVNTSSGHEVIDRAKELFEDAGVDTVYEQYISYDTTDVSPYLTSIKAEEPDVFYYFLDNTTTVISMCKQIMALGGWGDIKVISSAASISNASNEAGAQGTYYWAYWLPGLPYEGAKKFEEAWHAVYGSDPTSIHVMLFTTIWAAVEAIDQAGVGADREDIARLMRSGTFGFEAPGGYLEFGTDGEPNMIGFVGQIKNGEGVIVGP